MSRTLKPTKPVKETDYLELYEAMKSDETLTRFSIFKNFEASLKGKTGDARLKHIKDFVDYVDTAGMAVARLPDEVRNRIVGFEDGTSMLEFLKIDREKGAVEFYGQREDGSQAPVHTRLSMNGKNKLVIEQWHSAKDAGKHTPISTTTFDKDIPSVTVKRSSGTETLMSEVRAIVEDTAKALDEMKGLYSPVSSLQGPERQKHAGQSASFNA